MESENCKYEDCYSAVESFIFIKEAIMLGFIWKVLCREGCVPGRFGDVLTCGGHCKLEGCSDEQNGR